MVGETSDAELKREYEAFLYAPVAEQDNGTPVSVVSALARGGLDPWKAAERLARLPADRAQRVLVEILGEGFGGSLSFSEREAAAKRLVPLLPSGTPLVPMTAASLIADDAARQLAYWLVWFGFIVMLILVEARDRAPVTNAEYPVMKSQLAEDSGKSDHQTQSNRARRAINRSSDDPNY